MKLWFEALEGLTKTELVAIAKEQAMGSFFIPELTSDEKFSWKSVDSSEFNDTLNELTTNDGGVNRNVNNKAKLKHLVWEQAIFNNNKDTEFANSAKKRINELERECNQMRIVNEEYSTTNSNLIKTNKELTER